MSDQTMQEPAGRVHRAVGALYAIGPRAYGLDVRDPSKGFQEAVGRAQGNEALFGAIKRELYRQARSCAFCERLYEDGRSRCRGCGAPTARDPSGGGA